MQKKGSVHTRSKGTEVIKEENLSDSEAEEFSFYHLKEGESGKKQLIRLR